MRKFVRDNLIELLTTISEGLSYILTLDDESANEMLSNTFDAINAIGQTLEESLTPEIFEIYNSNNTKLQEAFDILQTDVDDMSVIQKALDDIIFVVDETKKRLNKEKEVKKEVVFFPYKAAMWDSLESVWKAAKADDKCFVSVVPIPYCDRDNTGKASKLYYDGKLFPEYVEITHYEDYDIALTKPDIAYIHNPYDGNNYVTSVDPKYYSHELKKNVKTLVYVPYYVGSLPSSDIFAYVASQQATDIIIASSKEDAAIYKKEGAKQDVAPLGSPKIDKILDMEKNKPEIPKEWSKIKEKKVFFLNTSISSLLQYNENYLNKIKALIVLFEKRKDAALIWRPHPLTVSTLTSMRPQLLAIYQNIEQTIESNPNVIIDKTPDMCAAMALSDAYIGDGISSLVYLYALTGKPIYLLNFEIPIAPTQEELNEMATSDTMSLKDNGDGTAWGFCNSINALCKLDLKTGKAEYISSVPDEDNILYLYGYPTLNGSKLLIPPYNAKKWAEFDTLTGKWNKRDLSNVVHLFVPTGYYFATALDTDDFAIFYPLQSNAFVKYDKTTSKLEYHTKWYKQYERDIKNRNLTNFGAPSKLIGNSLYFPSIQSNIVLELDIISMNTTIHKIGKQDDSYRGITFDSKNFWLTKHLTPGANESKNSVVRWNKNTGQCKEFKLEPVTYNSSIKISEFHSIMYYSDKVWVFPFGVSEIFQIDPETEKVSVYEHGLPYKLGERKSSYYQVSMGVACGLYPEQFDGCLPALSYYDYSLLLFTPDTETMKKIKPVINGIGELLNNQDATLPYYLKEHVFLTSIDYINKVCSGDIPVFNEKLAQYHQSVNANSDGTCGQKIHDYVMKKAR